MSADKHKNIPTLEDVVQPSSSKSNDTTKKGSQDKTKRGSDRRKDDRRKKQAVLPEGKPERRVIEHRGEPRRAEDQRRSAELTELVEKIMQDMMPDLQQHLFMQLRFELQKHMPKILSEFKDKDDK